MILGNPMGSVRLNAIAGLNLIQKRGHALAQRFHTLLGIDLQIMLCRLYAPDVGQHHLAPGQGHIASLGGAGHLPRAHGGQQPQQCDRLKHMGHKDVAQVHLPGHHAKGWTAGYKQHRQDRTRPVGRKQQQGRRQQDQRDRAIEGSAPDPVCQQGIERRYPQIERKGQPPESKAQPKAVKLRQSDGMPRRQDQKADSKQRPHVPCPVELVHFTYREMRNSTIRDI
mmetsp:Transcript_6990/g.11280  ORF Transcript_6990/g.11280 Transcript_6990/m.11280 type:complete len:225 (+) Transcript_6990:1440-2114(+)